MSRATDYEKAYIFAGRQIEAIQFMRDRNLSWRQVVLVDAVERLKGSTPAVVYAVGTYRQHPRYREIAAEIQDRGIRVEVVS